MAPIRVRMPCPKCGEEILLNQRQAMLADFEVGCPNCKVILHTSDLMKKLRGAAKKAEEPSHQKRLKKDNRSVSAESIGRKTCS